MNSSNTRHIPVLVRSHGDFMPIDAGFQEGIFILIDKPETWTSFDVVNKIRRLTKVKKVGHCGTLDPLATGLLVIAVGKATKSIDEFTSLNKTYEAEMLLGVETDTYDADGNVIFNKSVPDIGESEWPGIFKEWIGEIQQIPPAFSALKQNGVPLYKLARKGVEVRPEPRTVRIYTINVISWKTPILRVSVHCGKGTYIRSLAHDIGKRLSCGATITGLRRTEIGTFSVQDAWSIPEFQNWLEIVRETYAIY